MSEETERSIELTRLGKGHYEATNPRGARLVFGTGQDDLFSPVELLLAAVAGCSAVDVDFITVKRAEPDRFQVTMRADKVRDENGNRLTNLELSFDVGFPEGESGDAARSVLPEAVRRSHDRLCTVSRTVELPTPVAVRVVS